MKTIIAFATLLIITTISFSQPTTATAPSITKSDYLKKSKDLQTTAWVWLGGGSALFLAGTICLENFDDTFWTETLFLIGSTAMLASIPLSLAAHRNKKKGMRLSFKNESIPKLQQGSFVSQAVPSLTLKLIL